MEVCGLSNGEEKLKQRPLVLKTLLSLQLQNRSESMASIYSQDGGRYGTVTVRGEVEFGMLYSFSSGSLEVAIKQCKDLAPVDTKRNRSDP